MSREKTDVSGISPEFYCKECEEICYCNCSDRPDCRNVECIARLSPPDHEFCSLRAPAPGMSEQEEGEKMNCNEAAETGFCVRPWYPECHMCEFSDCRPDPEYGPGFEDWYCLAYKLQAE